MSYVFHESRVVVIETSRRVVRAVLGLGELLHIPSVVRHFISPLEYFPAHYEILHASFIMVYHNPLSRSCQRASGCADPSSPLQLAALLYPTPNKYNPTHPVRFAYRTIWSEVLSMRRSLLGRTLLYTGHS
jgi:hypothetical protein